MQIKIEIMLLRSERIEVTIAYANDDRAIMDDVEAVVSKIVKAWPLAVVRIARSETETVSLCPTANKRGGPAGTPENQKQWIVRGWLEVQGRMNQEVYANSKGISSSTLRRWMRELRANGKL